MAAIRSMAEVYLNLEILDTPFRIQRIKDHGWTIYARAGGLPSDGGHQLIWVNRRCRMTAMEGREVHIMGTAAIWHHLSISHADRQPTWDEMSELKRLFMTDSVEAYIVHPPASRYVNINPRVLHWYSCMDRPNGVLPDFRVEGAGLIPGQIGI